MPLDSEFAISFVGGRGWGAKIIFNETSPETDPLGPENVFVIATGPLTGTLVPAAGKMSLSGLSPQTGLYGDSNIGSMFGVELKQAGFDAIVISGTSKKLIYISIDDGNVELKDATHLSGAGALDAEIELRKELGTDFRVLTIGPAGENLVKFACISGDYGRQAGRTGMGAILGSKKVKALVARGYGDIPVANPREVKRLFEVTEDYIVRHKLWEIWRRQGTTQVIDWSQEQECLPTKNFQYATFDSYREINGYALEKRKIGDRACFACPMPCRNLVIEEIFGKKVMVEGPEYETASLLGANCGISNMSELIYASYLCDNLGLDTISAGVVTSFAMECYERGILSKDQLDGLDLRFGNSEAMFEFLTIIAKREGIGNLFAEGVKKASERIGKGSEKFAMHVKGLEISGYEHRAAQAMALAYATCDVGAHHNRAWAITYDVEVGRTTYGRDKVKKVIYLQHARSIFDCIGVCRFPWGELGLNLNFYAKSYTAVTGIPMSLRGLMKASERIYNLTRLINVRKGLTRKDDFLPSRDFDDPIPSGRWKGIKINKAKFEKMIDAYYELRGWNKEGVPTKKKLRELSLEAS